MVLAQQRIEIDFTRNDMKTVIGDQHDFVAVAGAFHFCQKIAESREWTRHYPVVLALAQNPKVPIHRATTFIKQLHERDLKALVLDRNINPVVRQLAIGYFKTRNIGKR